MLAKVKLSVILAGVTIAPWLLTVTGFPATAHRWSPQQRTRYSELPV